MNNEGIPNIGNNQILNVDYSKVLSLNIIGKPYITVSSKGITNGLSTIPNDGADFGPDTSLGATNPNQIGGSTLTQTSGIQEAVNYIIANGGGKLYVKKGHYVMGSGATFSKVGNICYDGTNTADFYALFNLNSTNVTGIYIEGETMAIPSTGGNTTTIPFLWGGVTIDMSNVTLPSTSNIYVVFGAQNTNGQVTNPVTTRGITVMAPTPMNFGHTIISSSSSCTVEYCALIPLPGEQNFFSGIASTNPLNIGFHISGQDGNMAWANMLYVQQAYTSYILTSHATAGTIGVQSCIRGLIPNGGYTLTILHYDVQGTTYPIYLNANGTGGYTTLIVDWQEEDYSAVSNVNTAFKTIYDVYCEYNGSPSQALEVHVINAVLNRNNASNDVNPKVSGGLFIKFDNLQFIGQNTLPATLSVNPPVSGTVYQNTNPYDIEIDLPAYATTSGTAGYVTLAKGPTSTPTSIGNQFVNGATSSTSAEIIKLEVPAGWYYSFTASGVTLGTSTVFAK